MSKSALGRGLSALLGGKPSGSPPGTPASAPLPLPATASPAAPPPPEGPTDGVSRLVAPGLSHPDSRSGLPGDRVDRVGVERIRPSALQPRRDFPPESLRELANSIREQGILQPLVVRRQGDVLELIAGERRWRAAQLAGLTEVPVIVRDADDTTTLELMLVENLQREGLNPLEEAQGYAELIERFQLTQDSVATKVGRSRTAVANALRLLKLPADVQAMLRDGRIASGHAKVILGLADPAGQSEAARRVVAEALSVRQTEELVTRLGAATREPARPTARPATEVAARDPHVVAVEDRLRQRFGTKVTVRYRQGRGQIDIRFFSDDELERVLEIVGVRLD